VNIEDWENNEHSDDVAVLHVARPIPPEAAMEASRGWSCAQAETKPVYGEGGEVH
jgi:hypothetical protein